MAKQNLRLRGHAAPGSGLCGAVARGIMISFAVSLLLLLLLTAVALFSEIDLEQYLQYVVVTITLTSIFAGSVMAAYRSGNKGLIIGVTVGVVYVLITTGIGLKTGHELVTAFAFASKALSGSAAGALGGVLGINLSS